MYDMKPEGTMAVPYEPIEPRRESVESKLNTVGESMCVATRNIREAITIMFGLNGNDNCPSNNGTGLSGLATALEADARALLNASEELLKRCGS